MKTLYLIFLFIAGWMLFLNKCKILCRVVAAERVLKNELKISEDFTAYIATTKVNGNLHGAMFRSIWGRLSTGIIRPYLLNLFYQNYNLSILKPR